MGGSSAQYLSCKVFRDWSIIKLWEINNMYEMGRSLLHILNQHLIAFFDFIKLVWLIKKGPCILVYFKGIFLSCRVPTFRGQNAVNHAGHYIVFLSLVY